MEIPHTEPNNTTQQQTNQKKKKRVMQLGWSLLIPIVLIVFFLGFLYGRNSGSTSPQLSKGLSKTEVRSKDSGGRVDFDLFWAAWDTLGKKYVDEDSLVPQELLYGAIDGMFRATGDPYTNFFDPEINQAFNEELEGSFEGIGAEIGIRNTFLTIIAPLAGSPAEKAGLRAGDSIIQIDGEVSAEMTIEDAVKKIRGDKGTEVVLTIFREGENDTKDIAVVRDTIVIDSVTTEFREDGIAVIQVTQFGLDTTREFKKTLLDIRRKEIKKIVIDLRNNPGGVLDGAITMIGYFTEPNSIAVIEQASGDVQNPSRTKGKPLFDESVSIAILINQGSASASEIFAAALNEHLGERVTLVGEKSFGKGSVQELVPLKHATAAKITVAKWLSPTGEQIDGVGIKPEVQITYTNEDFDADRDPQLDAATRILNGENKEAVQEEYAEENQQEIVSEEGEDEQNPEVTPENEE